MSEYTGCDKCKYFSTNSHCFPCKFCKHNVIKTEDRYTPMTNADRIRNMTDEELAKFFGSTNSTIPCGTCPVELANDENGCVECILKWLQAEVKEES